MRSLVKTKSLFGSAPETIRRMIINCKERKNGEDLTYLIIDDKDGYLVLYPLCCNFRCTVFEPNRNFIDGGSIEVPVNIPDTNDYVYISQKVNGLNDRVRLEFKDELLNVINRNFYEIDNTEQYDYVCACRSIDRDENKDYTIELKLGKLKNAVKADGYLFIEYLVAIDDNNYDKYPKNTFFRMHEIEEYFDTKVWTVISNEINITEGELTPLNRKKEKTIVGHFCVRKKPTPVKKVSKNPKKIRLDFDNNEIACKHSYIINGVVR